MSQSSAVFAKGSTQRREAVRKEQDAKIASLRSLLRSEGPHGCKGRIAEAMGCRVDRLSREDSPAAIEKLSVEYLDAAIALHTAEGRLELVSRIIETATRGWGMQVLRSGSVIRAFSEGGQLTLRLEESR